MNRGWTKTEIDNSGTNQTVSNLLFVGNGQVSFDQNYTSWLGEWSTNNGELNISFENGSINGTYSYNVQKKGGGNAVNGVSQSAITDLELTPISISDSLESNNLKTNVYHENIEEHLVENKYEWIDIDPFGTPAPFLEEAVESAKKKETFTIS